MSQFGRPDLLPSFSRRMISFALAASSQSCTASASMAYASLRVLPWSAITPCEKPLFPGSLAVLVY
jgi:hypothetical protein